MYQYALQVEDRGTLHTPLMYMIKRRAPRIEPCETPEEIGRGEEENPEMLPVESDNRIRMEPLKKTRRGQ